MTPTADLSPRADNESPDEPATSRPDPVVDDPGSPMPIDFSGSTAYRLDRTSVPADPGELYDDVLANPSLCCQRCFRRLRRKADVPHDLGRRRGDVLAGVEYTLPTGEPDWNTSDREYYEHIALSARTVRVYPPEGATGQACAHCGAVKPHRQPDTRSRQTALWAASNVSLTLVELAVAHDPLALLVEVAELKCDPDYAGDDDRVFRTAVERAVRAGRTPSHHATDA